MQNFKSILFIVMFTSLLVETQHLCIIWKIEAVFQLFLLLHICHTILLSCGIDINAFSEQVK